MRQLMAAILALVLSSAVFGTIYVVTQQVERQGADDAPQRLASQVAADLHAGSNATVDALPAVDLGRSWSSWVVVIDGSDHVIGGEASLDGKPVELPRGVLATARSVGRDAVTWQPRSGLRFATVETKAGSRVVVAGQSLTPSETRTDQLGAIILLAWFVTSGVAIGGVYLVPLWSRGFARR